MFEHFTPAWREATLAFLAHIHGISGSDKSLYAYSHMLQRFFADPERQPDQYSRYDVQNFLIEKSTSPRNYGKVCKAGSHNQRLMIITSYYKFVSMYEVRNSDGTVGPLFDGKPPQWGLRYIKQDIPYRSLNEEETIRLFQSIPDTVRGTRDRAIMTFAFFTTRRRSEIARLQWRDIERAAIVDADGSTRPGYTFKHRDKGRSRQETVSELPGMAYNAIVDMLKAQGRLESITPDEYVFTSLYPGVGRKDKARNEHLEEGYMNHLFREYASKAGLDLTKCSFHSLRHAGAAARFREGEKIDSLSKVLGHTNIATTSRYLQQIVAPSDQFALKLERKYSTLFRRQERT